MIGAIAEPVKIAITPTEGIIYVLALIGFVAGMRSK